MDKEDAPNLVLNNTNNRLVHNILFTLALGVLLTTSIWFAYQCSYWYTRASIAEVQLLQIERNPELYLKTYVLEKMNETLLDSFDGMQNTSKLMLEALGMTPEEAIEDMRARGYIADEAAAP